MLAEVNGISIFYTKTGSGEPFILLHGNGEDHTLFDGLAEKLAAKYTVYALDSRGHGQSGKVENLSYSDMAEDVAAFITELGIEKPILLGFSDGAIIGLMLASKYPDMLSALISCGANTRPEQLVKWTLLIIKLGYFVTRDPKLKMMLTEPDISPDDLSKIEVSTLVIAGSRDIIPERYAREISENINYSQCLILPGENHISYIKDSQRVYNAIAPFLMGLDGNGADR